MFGKRNGKKMNQHESDRESECLFNHPFIFQGYNSLSVVIRLRPHFRLVESADSSVSSDNILDLQIVTWRIFN